MRKFVYILSFVLVALQAVFLASFLYSDNSPRAQELQVTAECLPHSQVESYRDMSVVFNVITDTQAPPSIQGVLNLDGKERYESVQGEWGVPQSHWLSLLFMGPRVELTTYCEEAGRFHGLHLSYFPKQGFKLLVNETSAFGGSEIDTIGESGRHILPIQPEGPYQNQYRAGKDTPSPYWIQFALSKQALEEGIATTSLRYQFP